MKNPEVTELRGFHQFVGDKVNNGGVALSPEEVLDEWRALHPEPDARDVEVAALQEAMDELENGDEGVPFEEFDKEFRERHRLPPPA